MDRRRRLFACSGMQETMAFTPLQWWVSATLPLAGCRDDVLKAHLRRLQTPKEKYWFVHIDRPNSHLRFTRATVVVVHLSASVNSLLSHFRCTSLVFYVWCSCIICDACVQWLDDCVSVKRMKLIVWMEVFLLLCVFVCFYSSSISSAFLYLLFQRTICESWTLLSRSCFMQAADDCDDMPPRRHRLRCIHSKILNT